MHRQQAAKQLGDASRVWAAPRLRIEGIAAIQREHQIGHESRPPRQPPMRGFVQIQVLLTHRIRQRRAPAGTPGHSPSPEMASTEPDASPMSAMFSRVTRRRQARCRGKARHAHADVSSSANEAFRQLGEPFQGVANALFRVPAQQRNGHLIRCNRGDVDLAAPRPSRPRRIRSTAADGNGPEIHTCGNRARTRPGPPICARRSRSHPRQ